MRVDAIVPDSATPVGAPSPAAASHFTRLIEAASSQLDRADAAESAFAHGRGGMQEMVLERARADIALQVAVSGTQHAAQALNSILGMQI